MSILGMMIASTGLFDSCAICKRTVRSVVGNIWCFGGGGEPRIGIPVRLTSPSFTRRQWVLNQMYNVMRRPAGLAGGCIRYCVCSSFCGCVSLKLNRLTRKTLSPI